MSKKAVHFTHNDKDISAFVDDGENLLDFLRRNIGDLTVKYGCGQGTCGACTVLINGDPRLSCLTLAEDINAQKVETIAGINDNDKLHPLQKAFMENFAAQCGYCTTGMILSAKALLSKNPNPSKEDVIDAISGNICRCTGYEPIINAILDVSNKKTV